jgi:hypothetical protein
MVIQIMSLLTFLATTDHVQKESPQAVATIAQIVTPNNVITRIIVSIGTRWLTFHGFMLDLNQFVNVGGH